MKLYIRRPELADTFGNGAPSAEDKRDGRWYMAKSLPQYGLSGWVERAWHAWLVLTDKARAVEFMCDRPNAGSEGRGASPRTSPPPCSPSGDIP